MLELVQCPQNKTSSYFLTGLKNPHLCQKGDNKSVFDVPPDYLNERYKPSGLEIVNRIGEDVRGKIPVKPLSAPPSLDEILELDRNDNFSLFIPKHANIAEKLLNLFLKQENVDDLLSLAVYVRDRVNPYLFNYAFTVALLHRPDTNDLDIPSFVYSFPDKYVDAKVFSKAREVARFVPEEVRVPIEIPKDYTASDLEVEHRIAYFREDLAVNLHHWHWHLVYPFQGDLQVVNKNRRGELFYYMHQQILARYNFERLSNKMHRVERFSDFKAKIKEAYFPKLESLVASKTWPARQADQQLSNLNRRAEQIKIDISDLERWRKRIYDAISTGEVRTDDGKTIKLTENEGIDVLGNILESSILSPNRVFYGNLHGMGHVFIAAIHDPDNRHLESFGVMGDPATAMRDPMFYRWHATIDDIFQEFKSSLPRYTINQLNFPGIKVTEASIESTAGQNRLETIWQKSDIDLSGGLDFAPRGPVYIRFTHLNHRPFSYKITIDNDSNGSREGTCRIFLCPKHDESEHPWKFKEQRLQFIELDKFKVNLKQGQNIIMRSSSQSSVTIPFERTFRQMSLDQPAAGQDEKLRSFCGCGWPHHMLIPKGNAGGMPCQLFVMISNYKDDKVEQDTEGPCNDAESYCGIKDKLYPDRRSIGYPFDREPRSGVDTIDEFLTPNMIVQEVEIKFTNKTYKPKHV